MKPFLPLMFDRIGIRAVDRAAIEEFGVPGIVLMENAARGLADQAMKMLSMRRAVSTAETSAPLVLIICGTGNNGGDGYALARHLHNHSVQVVIASLGEPYSESDAGINRAIFRKMELREVALDDLPQFAASSRISLIVDAIFGTGLDRPITGRAAEVIQWINSSGLPVLAADLPSGLDCDTGDILGSAVRATCTVTFVGWKIGFQNPNAQKLLGDVVVADIGAPRELTERFGKLQH